MLGADAKNKLLAELSELDQQRAKLSQKTGRLVLDLARERLIRSTNNPVLVALRSFKPIKKVLVAFDGRRSSYGAIDFITSNTPYLKLECHIVIAGEGGRSWPQASNSR